MGFADVWNRTLVYFGIAEEDDDWDEDGYVTEEELEGRYRERPNVRRLAPRRAARGAEYDDWTDSSSDAPAAEHTAVTPAERPARAEQPRLRSVDAVPTRGAAKVHLVIPRSFNDAQQVADRFKDGSPVILNLQNSDAELSKRLIDFASGLTYALGRRHAARGGQGLSADASQRRGLRRGAGEDHRARRVLQPALTARAASQGGAAGMPNIDAMGVTATAPLAAVGDSIASFVDVFVFVYVLLILAYVITSWIRLPYSPWLNRVQRFLYDVCEPYLRLFRRIVPQIGPLDLSPMVAVIVLLIVQSVVVRLLSEL